MRFLEDESSARCTDGEFARGFACDDDDGDDNFFRLGATLFQCFRSYVER